MKALVCSGRNGWSDVSLTDIDKPEVRPRGVIIKTEAAALNFPDVLQPKGLYQDIPAYPFVLGLEFAGTVVEIGADCKRLKIGDRVAGMGQGAFGEYVSAREQMCFSMPEDLDFETAAALPLSGGTAMLGLENCANLKRGETLVVLGATGGTGIYGVQIGKANGAEVIAVCSTAEKAETARQTGADHTVDLSKEDLSSRLKELTAQKGIDVVYDPVGGDLFDICCRRMAMGGRLLTVGYASGRIPALNANLALLKSFSMIGVNWSATAWNRPDISHRLMERIIGLVTKGTIEPQIESTVPFEEAIKALKRMESRQSIGKTVIRTSGIVGGNPLEQRRNET